MSINRGADYVEIMADERRRQVRKSKFNAQDYNEVIILPIGGEAGTGLSFARSERIYFNVLFKPLMTPSNERIPPSFTYGFTLNTLLQETTPVGLLGVAKIFGWSWDKNGYYDGFYVDIGVVNMSAGATFDTPAVKFRGEVTLSFAGRAYLPPHTISDDEEG